MSRAGAVISFPGNGDDGSGYLAMPPSGAGPGLVVIQEWWGLVPQIEDMVDRFAAAGFVVLAPDLYRGTRVSNAEPDEAAKQMMALDIGRAARDMVGAVDALAARDDVTGSGIGVVGFCMGGGLALWLASLRPGVVTAVAPFYGVLPWPDAQPDYAAITARVQGHYAELDDFASPAAVAELETSLRGAGVDVVDMFIEPGVGHAFMNHTRPEAYDEATAERAWGRVLAFLHEELDAP